MATPLLTLDDVALSFGDQSLFHDLSLMIGSRERIALVGRNGSGKSTLLKVIAGPSQAGLEVDAGKRHLSPGTTVLYLPQEPDFSPSRQVGEYLENAPAGFAEAPSSHLIEPMADFLSVSLDSDLESLSGGEARRVALVKAIAQQPDILLLDEPTNHLDIEAIEWLEDQLSRFSGALVIISHDRQFLERLTNKTIWLDRGRTHNRNSGFAGFEDWRDKILEEEAAEHHKLGRKIAAEEHWLRYGVTARRKRNVRRLKALHTIREDFKTARKPTGNVNFSSNQAESSGKMVVEVEAICKSFGARTIVDDLTFRLSRGDRLGLVGPNGAGKTTLLKLLTGSLSPDTGTVRQGAGIEMTSLDQQRALLSPTMRVADAITDGRGDFVMLGETKRHVASYLQDFLFTQEQWRAPVSSLSGGERGRLALAAILAKPSNLLVLDEPTNDLDMETLDLLQEMLSDYEGTLILVSHDRSFLDRTVTGILTPVSLVTGEWKHFAGGYTDMRAQLGERGDQKKRTPISGEKKPKQKAPSDKPSGSIRAEKLSYKEQYALDHLPEKISSLESMIAQQQSILSEADLFAKNPDRFETAVKALERAQRELEEAEETWLEVEMKREALEQSE